MAETIPGADVVVLEAAHLANVEAPGPFNAAILEHLEPKL
jgi:pimeloyl-ACP methyl ester carboxylesterase